ncbi:uncharacterized protein M6B38_108610 [Iris pallida]|uniref:Retrotransposon gag domain-containing protein n=1 Tax=Iris pallida TaxID=29817 RepID=A0AAX6EGR4_IRIPA|nr:uncharacterized protein M6B38_108610 [Iris pallida]
MDQGRNPANPNTPANVGGSSMNGTPPTHGSRFTYRGETPQLQATRFRRDDIPPPPQFTSPIPPPAPFHQPVPFQQPAPLPCPVPALPPPPPTLDNVALLGIVQQIMNSQNRQADVFREALQAREAPSQRPGTSKHFTDLRPWEFKGTEGILYADDWLVNMERNLRRARIPEDQKVDNASMQLYDIAFTWYRDEPRFSVPGVTWEEFKELFKEKFYPEAAREELENEFESLEQGN